MVRRIAAWLVGGMLAALPAMGRAEAAATIVQRIEVNKVGAAREVVIHTSTKPTFTVFRMADPMRIVVDVSSGDVSKLTTPLTIEDGSLSQIVVRQFAADGFQVGRIIIGFEADMTYRVRAQGNAIVVDAGPTLENVVSLAPLAPVDPQAEARPKAAPSEAEAAEIQANQEREAAARAAQQAEAKRLATEVSQAEKSVQRARAEVDTSRAASDAAAVTPVETLVEEAPRGVKVAELSSEPRGAPTRVRLTGVIKQPDGILIKLDGQPAYDVQRVDDPPRLVIDLQATVRALRQRTIRVNHAGVRQIRFGSHGTMQRAVVDLLHAGVQPTLEPTAEGLMIRVDAHDDEEKAWAATAHASSDQVAGFAAVAPQLVVAQAAPSPGTRKKKISINLKDADLVNVLRFLAEVSGENMIISDQVSGKVTMQFKDVAWDVVMDTLLKTRSYDSVRKDGILRIAPADVIQRERELEIAKNKALQDTEKTQIKLIPINYAKASEVVTQVQGILSPRGKTQVDDRTNMLIVEDIGSNLPRVLDMVKTLDRQTPQVLIEARIVEVSSSEVEQFGIQWGGTAQMASRNGNPTGLAFPGEVVLGGAADDGQGSTVGTSAPGRYAINLPAPIGAGAGGGIGFTFGSAGGGQLLNLRLSALEETGKGQIISSPRVTTLDNKQATISQGVDIPVSVVSAAGVSTRLVQARLQLVVTPHVTNDGSVLLKIQTTKNEPDFGRVGASGDPSILNKEAQTEVLVQDGETTVIGGIYTRTESSSRQGIPIISNIPILGALFRSTRTEDRRTEMLIFVTPRIVNRESALGQPGGSLPAPAEGSL